MGKITFTTALGKTVVFEEVEMPIIINKASDLFSDEKVEIEKNYVLESTKRGMVLSYTGCSTKIKHDEVKNNK